MFYSDKVRSIPLEIRPWRWTNTTYNLDLHKFLNTFPKPHAPNQDVEFKIMKLYDHWCIQIKPICRTSHPVNILWKDVRGLIFLLTMVFLPNSSLWVLFYVSAKMAQLEMKLGDYKLGIRKLEESKLYANQIISSLVMKLVSWMQPWGISGRVFACFVEFSSDNTVDSSINAIFERLRTGGKPLFWVL